MQLIVEKKSLVNADGVSRSMGGARDLKQALKLKAQGLANVKFLGRTVGMTGQYTGIHTERYLVTFK